ncbi:MAG TPA: ABC transporter ATP-binding protein [Thermoanaerobaculia bacterium]|nr:ABC transporter ATP-binding protein [Thermoanaerobaculia bacterium]
MIETRKLTKEYEPGARALDGLNLEVAEGEVYCLLGANGAGKTTAIHLLLDFISPTSGEALIDGINVARKPLEAKTRVAFLPENVQLYGALSVRQNLGFFCEVYGKRMEQPELEALLEEVGLPAATLDRRVRHLSKGMRQKLGLAIVAVKGAQNLILDEPLSGLDPEAASSMVGALGRLRDRGTSILMSTHDVFRAKELADRVAILLDGRKILEKTREELRDADLERLYLEYIRGGRSESEK